MGVMVHGLSLTRLQSTRATIEVRHFFFLILPLILGAQDLSQNLMWRKNETARMIPNE